MPCSNELLAFQIEKRLHDILVFCAERLVSKAVARGLPSGTISLKCK